MTDMKTINVTFTDEEHDVLVKTKDDLNWHDFILKIKDLDDLLTWAWRFIEKADSGNAEYLEAMMAAGLEPVFDRVFGGHRS